VPADNKFGTAKLGAINKLLIYSGGEALSSFVDSPSEAGPEGVQPLLDRLDQELAAHGLDKRDVSVNVLATAGMRHVDADNPAASAAIYESVRNTVQAAQYTVGAVGTISGQDEGLYAWADVNYLKNVFQERGVPYGIVEIGGASAQVTYVSSASDNPNVKPVTINGVGYPVFSISYRGLGLNDARADMIAGGGVIDNPCYTRGYVFGANSGDPAPAVGVDSLTGNYDYLTCSNLYRDLITSYFQADSPMDAGFSATRFLLTGASIPGVLHNWGVTSSGPSSALSSMAQQHCQGALWSDFYASFQQYSPSRFLQSQCSSSTYLGVLLHDADALGLRTDQTASTPDIDGTATTWTLGYVLISEFGR
jgi:hypothetical protein